jgi:hypothetical protein
MGSPAGGAQPPPDAVARGDGDLPDPAMERRQAPAVADQEDGAVAAERPRDGDPETGARTTPLSKYLQDRRGAAARGEPGEGRFERAAPARRVFS